MFSISILCLTRLILLRSFRLALIVENSDIGDGDVGSGGDDDDVIDVCDVIGVVFGILKNVSQYWPVW